MMVATSYPANVGDWRGLFIRHLANALGRREDLQVQLWAPPGDHGSGVTDASTPAEASWLDRLAQSGGIAHQLRQNALSGGLASIKLLRHLHRAYKRNALRLDLVHCNWLQTMLPVPRRLPVLVTVLGTDMQLLKLPLMPTLLRWTMRGRPVAICPNAEWMQAPLLAMFGRFARVETVPFGIEASWFAVSRELRPMQPSRWLVVSRLTHDKLGDLLSWGEALFRDQSRELHLFGPMQEQIDLPSWIHFHGPATPDQLRNDWFAQAQGLITLSRHSEGRPQVMLEAMAAGLPIVASNLPAHADLLAPNHTGLLCDTPEAFAQALLQIENPVENHRIGTTARNWAREHIGTWDDCAMRYAKIYRELLVGTRS